jgi:hypothetical protein
MCIYWWKTLCLCLVGCNALRGTGSGSGRPEVLRVVQFCAWRHEHEHEASAVLAIDTTRAWAAGVGEFEVEERRAPPGANRNTCFVNSFGPIYAGSCGASFGPNRQTGNFCSAWFSLGNDPRPKNPPQGPWRPAARRRWAARYLVPSAGRPTAASSLSHLGAYLFQASAVDGRTLCWCVGGGALFVCVAQGRKHGPGPGARPPAAATYDKPQTASTRPRPQSGVRVPFP